MKSQRTLLLSGGSIYQWHRSVPGLLLLLIALLALSGCGGGDSSGDATASEDVRDPAPVVTGCDDDMFVEAPVEAADTNTQTLTLLGLTVRVDDHTRFDNVSLADLVVGDYVDMYGFMDADDAIVASCLGREVTGDGEVELRGPVDADGIAASRLFILGVEVQTDANTVFEDGNLTQTAFFAQVRSGAWVEVEGRLQADGSIRAEDIEFDDGTGDFDDDDDGSSSGFDDDDDSDDDDDDDGFDDDDDSSISDLDDDDDGFDDDDDDSDDGFDDDDGDSDDDDDDDGDSDDDDDDDDN